MNRKRLFSGICSLVVVFGFILLGCPEDGDSDKWMPIKNLSEIRGRWEGSSFITVPEIPIGEYIEMLEYLDDEMWELLPEEYGISDTMLSQIMSIIDALPETLPAAPLDYSVKLNIADKDIDIELTVDCKRYLEEITGGSALAGAAWVGLKIAYDVFLSDMMESLQDDILEEGIGFEPPELTNNYEIIMHGSVPLPEEDIDFSELQGTGISLEINGNRNELKLHVDSSLYDDMLPGLKVADLILNKR